MRRPAPRFSRLVVALFAIFGTSLVAQTAIPTTPAPRNQPADRMDRERHALPSSGESSDRTPRPAYNTTDRNASERPDIARIDRRFLEKSLASGRKEVVVARLAAGRSTNTNVKSFAEQIVAAHEKSNAELVSLATRKGVPLPEADSPTDLARKWEGKDGDDFDEAFIEHMVDTHEESVARYHRASRRSKDPEIVAFATKTLPTLQEHLTRAEQLEESLD